MNSKKTDLAVGLFVIFGFAALLFLCLKAGNLTSSGLDSRTYTLVARFDNIGGLKARAAVRAAGVVVGRVARIDFDNKAYQASATLEIYDRFHFPKDTAAKILTSGLLGEQYVGLDPGGDPDYLSAGDRITNTQSAVILENLIGQFLFNKAADSSTSSDAAAPAAAGTTPASGNAAALPSPSLAVPSLSTPSAPAKDPKK
jgi:phospholipid/cholesterol/gamma-HCH transport system substrate-binding protein